MFRRCSPRALRNSVSEVKERIENGSLFQSYGALKQNAYFPTCLLTLGTTKKSDHCVAGCIVNYKALSVA